MYELFGVQFDNSFIGLMCVVFFIGLTGGWFIRKASILGVIAFLVLIVPVAMVIMQIDSWTLTVPFVLGVLVHTFKPIKERLTS
jgi:hypothetical protein